MVGVGGLERVPAAICRSSVDLQSGRIVESQQSTQDLSDWTLQQHRTYQAKPHHSRHLRLVFVTLARVED